MFKFAGMCLGVLIVMFAGTVPSFAGLTIASHRAIYELVLDEKDNKSGLTSADGRMAFEISGSKCDGWTVNFRMVNQFRPSEDKERLIDTRSSSWESGDGMQLRYNQSEFVDNALDTETVVSAKRDEAGGEGSGEITKPSTKSFKLTREAIFPVQHQLKLMEAADQGQSRDVSMVYDGSDEAAAYRTISFIGPRHEAGKSNAPYAGKGADKLAAVSSWPVSISYYDDKPKPEDSGEQTPVYQVSFEMFANGVAESLVLNYGDFSLRGKLSSLEFLDQPQCD